MMRLIASTLFVLATAGTGLFAVATPAEASCNSEYSVCLNDHVYTARSELRADYEAVKCAARWSLCVIRTV